jgi:CubicO group peptidase (beta-lactamase class C family)
MVGGGVMSASSLVRAAIALLVLCAAGAARAVPADKVQDFAAFVTDERSSAKLPALAVGVANRAGVLTVAQSGVRDRERGGQVRPGDRYHLGSISKSMTATMVARLVDAGTLRWDSTPAEVWPELASGMDPAFRTITLEMILRHRAGLPAMESDREVARAPKFAGDARRQRAGFARWLTSARPPHPVGRFLYSNAGYGLAAAMAERAAGASWDELMRREIFSPLQMTSCGFGWPARGEPRGHRYRDSAFAVHDLTMATAWAPTSRRPATSTAPSKTC